MTKNKRTPRIFVEDDLAQDGEVKLTNSQTHYLVNVVRLKHGDEVQVFNGRQGEWSALVEQKSRRDYFLKLDTCLKEQDKSPALVYAFAPLKGARLDYIGQKAVEMGVGVLQPVITQHTVVRDPNLDRIWLNAIEGAEQCGIMTLPDLMDPVDFEAFLKEYSEDHTIIYGDETLQAAQAIKALGEIGSPAKLAVLIGPEGGFSESELTALRANKKAHGIALGPRILRADTAAVAALALVQSLLGDWA